MRWAMEQSLALSSAAPKQPGKSVAVSSGNALQVQTGVPLDVGQGSKSRLAMQVKAGCSVPTVVGIPLESTGVDQVKRLQKELISSRNENEDLRARLASAEEELQDTKLRCKVLQESLQAAQALRLGEPSATAPAKVPAGDDVLVSDLLSRISDLESKLARVAPQETGCPSIHRWLEGIRPGFGDRFGDCFLRSGYEDVDDVAQIPHPMLIKEVEQIISHLRFAGAKPPQERQISSAIFNIAGNNQVSTPVDHCEQPAALPESSTSFNSLITAATGPQVGEFNKCLAAVSIECWLDNVRPGFGARFAKPFLDAGYETAADIVASSPHEIEANLEPVFHHMRTFSGAKPPQMRLVHQAALSLSQAGTAVSVAPVAGSSDTAVAEDAATQAAGVSCAAAASSGDASCSAAEPPAAQASAPQLPTESQKAVPAVQEAAEASCVAVAFSGGPPCSAAEPPTAQASAPPLPTESEKEIVAVQEAIMNDAPPAPSTGAVPTAAATAPVPQSAFFSQPSTPFVMPEQANQSRTPVMPPATEPPQAATANAADVTGARKEAELALATSEIGDEGARSSFAPARAAVQAEGRSSRLPERRQRTAMPA